MRVPVVPDGAVRLLREHLLDCPHCTRGGPFWRWWLCSAAELLIEVYLPRAPQTGGEAWTVKHSPL